MKYCALLKPAAGEHRDLTKVMKVSSKQYI